MVIVGRPDDPAVDALRRAALSAARPLLLVQAVADGTELPPSHPAHGKTAVDGRAAAYVCIGARCGLPLTAADDLVRLLGGE